MKTREEAIAFCRSLPDSYEDYPFRDGDWTVMRRRSNRKSFALIFERQECIWINVKCRPEEAAFWRGLYPGSLLPAYHMNKEHWNSLLLNGGIPEEELRRMIAESHRLVETPQRRKKR